MDTRFPTTTFEDKLCESCTLYPVVAAGADVMEGRGVFNAERAGHGKENVNVGA